MSRTVCEHGREIPDDDYMACDDCTNQAADAMREKAEQLNNALYNARIEGARLAIEAAEAHVLKEVDELRARKNHDHPRSIALRIEFCGLAERLRALDPESIVRKDQNSNPS